MTVRCQWKKKKFWSTGSINREAVSQDCGRCYGALYQTESWATKTKTQRRLPQLSLNEFSVSKHTPTEISVLSLLMANGEKKGRGGLNFCGTSGEPRVKGIIGIIWVLYTYAYIYVCAYISVYRYTHIYLGKKKKKDSYLQVGDRSVWIQGVLPQ